MAVKLTIMYGASANPDSIKTCLEAADCKVSSYSDGFVAEFKSEDDALLMAKKIKKIYKYADCSIRF